MGCKFKERNGVMSFTCDINFPEGPKPEELLNAEEIISKEELREYKYD